MIKISINYLEELLKKAKEQGCTKLKLQLYDNWEAVAKEQKNPSHPVEEYQVDSRFYNTIEFETVIKDQQATDDIVTKIQGDTLIVQVAISDHESLMRGLGIEEEYNH